MLSLKIVCQNFKLKINEQINSNKYMTLPVFLRNLVTSSTEARERGKVRIKSHGISASDLSTVKNSLLI